MEFDYKSYWRSRHRQLGNTLRATGLKCMSERTNEYLYRIVLEQYDSLLSRISFPNKVISVLDAGAGTGYFSLFLKNKGWKITSLDVSSEAMEHLKSRDPDIETICTDLRSMKFDKQFDIVHCFDVLYHILDDKEWGIAINKLCEYSRQHVIIHQRFLEKKPLFCSPHITYKSYKTIQNEFQKNGFFETDSIPTHFLSARIFTYRISSFFPSCFYKLDKVFLNLINQYSLGWGSHHIKVFSNKA